MATPLTPSVGSIAEPTWFPDSTTSPEDCRRWLDENHDWAFADEPGTGEDEDFDGEDD